MHYIFVTVTFYMKRFTFLLVSIHVTRENVNSSKFKILSKPEQESLNNNRLRSHQSKEFRGLHNVKYLVGHLSPLHVLQKNKIDQKYQKIRQTKILKVFVEIASSRSQRISSYFNHERKMP